MAGEWYTAIIYRSPGKLASNAQKLCCTIFVTPGERHCVAYAEVLLLPTSQRSRHVTHLQFETVPFALEMCDMAAPLAGRK